MQNLEIFFRHFLNSVVLYILVAGIAWTALYKCYPHRFLHKKIKAVFPTNKQLRRDITYSLTTFLVFALNGLLIVVLTENGVTKIYANFSEFGKLYFFVSILLTIVAHDAWFYWTHRLLHHRSIFRSVHRIHHLSVYPCPWAAFANHPIEAFVHAGFLLTLSLALPLHPAAIAIFVIYMTLLTVIGHLGYELFPTWFLDNKLTKWHNSSTHHDMHHSNGHCNYGLYFNWWDTLMRTNHRAYRSTFREITTRKVESIKTDLGNLKVAEKIE